MVRLVALLLLAAVAVNGLHLRKSAVGVLMNFREIEAEDVLKRERKKISDTKAEEAVEAAQVTLEQKDFQDQLMSLMSKSEGAVSPDELSLLVTSELHLTSEEIQHIVEQVRGDLVNQLQTGLTDLQQGYQFELKSYKYGSDSEMDSKLDQIAENIKVLKARIETAPPEDVDDESSYEEDSFTSHVEEVGSNVGSGGSGPEEEAVTSGLDRDDAAAAY